MTAWPGFRSHRPDVYALAEDKLAEDKLAYSREDAPRSCRSRVADATLAARTAAAAAFAKLVCFRSYCWSIPLGIVSAGLVVAWFVIALIVDAGTLDAKYGLAPLPAKAYARWGLSMYIIVPVIWLLPLGALCGGASRPARWIMYITSAFYLVLLTIGNALSTTRAHARRAIEPQFVEQFNDLYCNARMVHSCLSGVRDDVLVLAGIGDSAALDAAANATDGALSVFTRCNDAILASMHRDTESIVEDPNVYVPVGKIDELLGDCKAPRETDVWCGQRTQRAAPLSDAEQRVLPAPFASSPDMFDKYVDEWPRRMFYANVLLGGAVSCMLLAAASWKLRDVTQYD